MPWLFRRRSGKAAKGKESRHASVADRASSLATHDRASPHHKHSHPHGSLPPPARTRTKLQRPQSLRQEPPPESSLARRLSGRRPKNYDQAREHEIRAMSLPMPQKRPAGHSGSMQRGTSKKLKAGRFHRPNSHVSLALDDSIHSNLSVISETRAFRVSALDMFTPRPTVRCAVVFQYPDAGRTSPAASLDRAEPRRERRSLSSRDGRHSRRSSRIDDLADTLDAGALREILERDQRQRVKKAKTDHDRLRRRLERRVVRQETDDMPSTSATPRNEAVGLVGLGIADDVPTAMEGVRPSTPPQPQWVQTLPLTPRTHESSRLPSPVDSPVEEAVVIDAQAIRYSRESVSAQQHTRGPSNVSHLPELLSERMAPEDPFMSTEHVHDPTRSGSLHPVETTNTNPISWRGSSRRRSSDGKRMGIFASLFRRRKQSTQDQGRLTPSEISFSNTSRESMSRQPLPAHLAGMAAATPPITIRRPSSVPHRTMSKFREDLPESVGTAKLPLSPPDSRVHSPDIYSTSALTAQRNHQNPSDLRVQSVSSQSVLRSDSPVSPALPTTNIMSQSLASVDSEGSWLSGRPLKRASHKSQVQTSAAPTGLQRNDEFNASYEELGMADDEYFKRLTPAFDERLRYAHSNELMSRKASSTLMALGAAAESEEEQEEAIVTSAPITSRETPGRVKSIVGRQPTIVHRQARVHSAEGLLSIFTDERTGSEDSMNPADMGSESPDSPASETEGMVQRAKSVDLGKQHVRHLSAGSARLLDIQKRASTSSPPRALDRE